MTTLAFDAFAYAHRLRDVGITEQQAEVIAKSTTEVLRIAVESAKEEIHAGELATKRDLKEVELLIEKSKNSTLLWMFAMQSTFAGGLIGIMAKGFHWF